MKGSRRRCGETVVPVRIRQPPVAMAAGTASVGAVRRMRVATSTTTTCGECLNAMAMEVPLMFAQRDSPGCVPSKCQFQWIVIISWYENL